MKTKLIATLLIIVIIGSFFPNLIVNAEETILDYTNQFTMSITGSNKTSCDANVGDSISIDLNLQNGLENQETLGFLISYNPEKLKILKREVSSEIVPEEDFNASTVINVNDETTTEKTISVAYNIGTKGFYLKNNGKLATISFQVLKGGETEIKYKSIHYERNEGKDLTTVASNSKITITGAVAMTGIEVSPKNVSINKGNETQLTYEKLPKQEANTEATTDKTKVTWQSENTSVATVSETGKVTGIGVGTTNIVVTCGNFSDRCSVTVSNPLKSISLDKTSAEINKGDNLKLKVIKTPQDATITGQVEWTSDNETVATVENGTVRALKNGTANITASVEGKTATCTITVHTPISKITLNKTEAGIDVNETVSLNTVIEPNDADDSIVATTWESSDETVATVIDGVVTGVKHGKATISAKVQTQKGKNFTATCEVTVNAHLESIAITNGVNNKIELIKGQTETLKVTYNPAEFAESKTIIWESNAPDIAEVKNGTVIAKKEGIATITAKTVNDKTASITVEVSEIKISALVMNKNNTTIEKGEKEQLIATIEPENTTDDKTITWETSDNLIATVTNNGMVTAVAPGTTKIIAKAGDKVAECQVTVTCALQAIALNQTEAELEVGDNLNPLTVTKIPADATVDLADVTWESSNTSVATVTNGEVTALAPGTAIISAKLEGKTATCLVKVKATLKGVTIDGQNKPLELIENQTSSLKVIYEPKNATNVPKATWTSSDETVVRVDNIGKVTALKTGTATITVDYGNNIKATRTVEVRELGADEIAINTVIEKMNRKEEMKLDLLGKIEEGDIITWSSSDETIATIDEKTGVITALKIGRVTFIATVTSLTGGTVRTVNMVVDIEENHLKSTTLVTDTNRVEVGKNLATKLEMIGEYSSTQVTDDIEIRYTSSNESIATVDANGVITALKPGKVIIRGKVSAKDGEGNIKILETSTSEITIVKEQTQGTGEDFNLEETIKADENTVEGYQKESKEETPKTGDINVELFVGMMIVSLIGMMVILKKNK